MNENTHLQAQLEHTMRRHDTVKRENEKLRANLAERNDTIVKLEALRAQEKQETKKESQRL